MLASAPAPLIDGIGRRVSYLRLSVTDRCDLRCRYCMSERMTFLPPRELLSIEELGALGQAFVARGVTKIRLTGGEPLVRPGVLALAERLGALPGLSELTLTTNGMRLAGMADALVAAGIRRVNVSLDSRDPARFRHITRWGELDRALAGIAAAKTAGLAIKINMVALRGFEDEIAPMLEWCAAEGHDLTLIETMPLGEIGEDRTDRFLPLDRVRRELEARYTLLPLALSTGGPARYVEVEELGLKLGFISPLTRNFCETCNRVRLTASGKLYACLGHDTHVDLRAALRAGALDPAIDRVLGVKPARHDFRLETPAVARHMNVTGG